MARRRRNTAAPTNQTVATAADVAETQGSTDVAVEEVTGAQTDPTPEKPTIVVVQEERPADQTFALTVDTVVGQDNQVIFHPTAAEPVIVAAEPAPPPPVVDAIPDTPEQIARDKAARQVDEYLKRYVEALHNKISLSPETLTLAARNMYRAVRTMLDASCKEAFDVYWKFHVTYADNLMHESSALRGLSKLSKHDADILATVYTAFRTRAVRDTNPINWEKVVEATKCQEMKNYLIRKKSPTN